MNWEMVCAGFRAIACGGPSVEVKCVEYDSRRVGRGDVFVAMRGEATDGNRYIEAAVAQGAAAVVTDSHEAYAKLRREHVGVAAALVEPSSARGRSRYRAAQPPASPRDAGWSPRHTGARTRGRANATFAPYRVLRGRNHHSERRRRPRFTSGHNSRCPAKRWASRVYRSPPRPVRTARSTAAGSPTMTTSFRPRVTAV